MSKHIIFLIHGIGDTAPGWSADVQKVFRNSYRGYPELEMLVPFDQNFVFQEICYNDKFDDRRSTWREQASAVLAVCGQHGMDGGAAQLLAQYASEADKDNFLTTHVLDIVLYRFIPQLAEQVRTAVQKQILACLTAQPQDETVTWSIIAHSMGTAVAHDTLRAMYTQQSAAGLLPPSVTRPKVLAMFANVSRLLAGEIDVYTSGVCPGSQPGKGVCDVYLNACHRWDPIPVPRRFKPKDGWPDTQTRSAGRYVGVLNSAITQRNVHDFTHYLHDPKVHIPLFRALTWNGVIDDDRLKSACDEYEAATPVGRFNSWVEELKAMWPDENAGWRDVIKCFRAFQERARVAG